MVERLEIALINALTPQAKGRVERANQTLQDRLIKDMRLSNISSIAARHRRFCPSFMLSWNEKFAVPPQRRDTGAPAVDEDSGRSGPGCWHGARSGCCRSH